MTTLVVVGAQWGDEGKGKVVDLLSGEAHMVVRYGGGANAGHTLVIDGVKLVTHLVPSGVLHPGTRCVLADGMVIDPEVLLEEIDACRARGLLQGGELLIGDGAHVILPYHKLIEELRESRRDEAIGTTRRGIGPAYEAKAARRGVRVGDLLHRERLEALVRANIDEIFALVSHFGGEIPGQETVNGWIDSALRAGERLATSIGDAGAEVHRAVRSGAHVLFEGAQGALLDIDHGTYPFVTSSSTTAGGACQGVGVGPTEVNSVLGITKAYCTRVGGGPFPTEMTGEEAERWRTAGGEFGATTGRPRRCGWLDIAALRRAIRINGITALAVTKLDVLAGQGPIRVCTGYRVSGNVVEELPRSGEGEPVYETFAGWEALDAPVRSLEELPVEARHYLDAIASLTGVPLALVSVGPDREETIITGPGLFD